MSEHEKFEQVGRLAEHYGRVRGDLNHIVQKLSDAKRAYDLAAKQFENIQITQEGLSAPTLNQPLPPNINKLLGAAELREVLVERARLQTEQARIGDELRRLAPHLID